MAPDSRPRQRSGVVPREEAVAEHETGNEGGAGCQDAAGFRAAFDHLVGQPVEEVERRGPSVGEPAGVDDIGERIAERGAEAALAILLAAATGAWSSVIGMTRTCSGASQAGKAPAKCSIKIAMNRSNEPLTARWMITGRCGALSSPVYVRSNRSGFE